MSIESEIKKGGSKTFHKAYIKRRDKTTGLFESDWQDITKYVKKFGKVKLAVDDIRQSKFKFNNAKLVLNNNDGTFNENDKVVSIWNGYAPRERTLVKVDAGFYNESQGSNLIYSREELPTVTTMFIGVISGDVIINSNNEAYMHLNSLNQIFRDFPARNLRGFTVTGQTASGVIELIRDMTDGTGAFFFKPFFGDTVSNWDISTTTETYDNLNTGAAQQIRDLTTWELMEKLAEAESKALSIDRTGLFRFGNKNENTATTQFEFYGNVSNTEYGNTIKKINSYKNAVDKFYSRVEVKFIDEDTSSSSVIAETTMAVSGINNSWLYGQKTFKIENYFIANTTTAENIRDGLFTEVSELKNEIDFNTSFIPHLDILDKIEINYDGTQFNQSSLWDANNWDDELIWDDEKTPWDLSGIEFKILSIELDIDKFESKFRCREV